MTNSIEITVPKKFKTLTKPERYHVFHGGRGSGKSTALARYLIPFSMSAKVKILCTREMQNSISDSVHKLLTDVIFTYKLDKWFDVKNNEIECVNGSSFIFKGLAHNADSIKSTEGIDYCWVEEAQRVSKRSWDILIPTIRKQGSRIGITFNPENDDDPVYQMFIKKRPPDCIITEVNYQDNPYFPEVLQKEMEYMRSIDYEQYLHVWEGQTRTISDAQVFKGKYVVEDFSSDGQEVFYHGMDFGFAKDPSTIVRCFIKGENLYVDREVYGHQIEITDLPALMRGVLDLNYKVKADGARPETISYLRGQGFNIAAAKKWQGSVEDGIEHLRGFRKIIIHPRCKNTIKEFSRYSYKVDKHTNEILPIIVDDYNHCIDGDALVTTCRGEVKLKEVLIGDYALTRKGFQKVLFRGLMKQNAETITIVTKKGHKLTCTPEHKIFVPSLNEFVRADSLRYGLDLLTNEGKPCIRQLFIEALNSNFGKIKNILKPLLILVNQFGCTDMFGSKSADQFPKVGMFTISMVTSTITGLKTWSACLQKNIFHIMNGLKIALKKLENIWTKLDTSRKNGTLHLKALPGIKKMENFLTKTLYLLLKNVNIVRIILKQKNQDTSINIVQTHASQPTGEQTNLITFIKRVHFAIMNFTQVNTPKQKLVIDHVDKILVGKSMDVYDLTIENQHEFFADGILVSNCIDAIRYALDDMIRRKVSIYDEGVLR